MRHLQHIRILLFIYISIYSALRVNVQPLIMMKELKTENSIESLFWELIKDHKGSYTGGLRLLARLLESQTTPFMKQYIKHCKSYTLHTFLTLRFRVLKDPTLDLSKILSPDCIAASKVKFSEFEGRYVNFLEDHNVSPFSSSDFKPSQWSIETFHLFVRESSFLGATIDWSSWCGDVEITGELFSPEFWDSHDRLWRLLNYKCVKKMTESKRIMIRSRFPAIFKPKNGDTPRHAFMKIITLVATHLALKEYKRDFPQERAVIKENINSLLKQILIDYKRDESTSSLPWTAAKLVKSCGIQLDVMNFTSQSPRRLLFGIHRLLKNFSLINSSWILNLVYIFINNRQLMTVENGVNILINWFFDLNPTVQNICQLFEIIGNINHKLKETIILKFDEYQLTQIHRECPKHCNNLVVPLKSRVETVLQRKRQFNNHILKVDIPLIGQNYFWELLRILLRHEPMIIIFNTAKFEKSFQSAVFRSFDRFLEHFLELFLKNPTLYIRTGTKSDGRPIIVPNLTLPDRIVRLLFSILAKSMILNFNVPFYIPYNFFEIGFHIYKQGQFAKILKLKRAIYSDQSLIDNSDAAACDRINRDDDNVDLLADHVKRLCIQEPTYAKVSDSTFLRLMRSQLEAIHSGIYRVIPFDVVFTAEEIHSLIFKR